MERDNARLGGLMPRARRCLDRRTLISKGSRCVYCAARRRNGSTRDWRRRRERIIERDGHQCTEILEDGTRCPVRTGLEVHHVKPVDADGTDDDENPMTKRVDHNPRGRVF
jgi:5-methylcytosine-specific restriction endonuclease McrA